MSRFAAAAALACALLLAVPALAQGADRTKDNDTYIQLLAFNDFHGNLQPPSGSGGLITTGVGQSVAAGGIVYFATHLKTLRTQNLANTVVVGAGDQIGASPLVSGIFHDEPTIEALNLAGVDDSGVGNHEFDEGVAELLRMQYGGCHPEDGCQGSNPFLGAAFQYLAANVFYSGTNTTILPPYEIRKVGNAKIAFIGLTLEGTPQIVSADAVKGLDFRPEVQTVNNLVSYLRANDGVKAFVVLIHQGGQQNAPYPLGYQNINRCDNFTGPIVDIVKGLDDRVKVVVSAHTHNAYNCQIDGKLVTSAASFGRLITDIDLRIDHESKEIVAATANNVIVTRTVEPDAAEAALLAKYVELSKPIANRIVGSITGDITRAATPAGESALGDVIADAQLFSTQQDHHGGAVVAFMNPGGIRDDLTYANSPGGELAGQVTYSELFNVQPFNNLLQTKTMTGSQIYAVLEQQWSGGNAASPRILQVSNGFTYAYSSTPARHVVPGSVMIGGVPVDPLASYRVTMNNFLGGGGDNFTAFRDGTDTLNGQLDIDALVDYFATFSPIAPGPRDRIVQVG